MPFSGPLKKRTGHFRSWKQRYFVIQDGPVSLEKLHDLFRRVISQKKSTDHATAIKALASVAADASGFLLCYTNDSCSELVGIIDLRSVITVKPLKTFTSAPNSLCIRTTTRDFILSAASHDERKKWLSALNEESDKAFYYPEQSAKYQAILELLEKDDLVGLLALTEDFFKHEDDSKSESSLTTRLAEMICVHDEEEPYPVPINALVHGWILKQSDYLRKWNRRFYYVVRDDSGDLVFNYYRPPEKSIAGAMVLSSSSTVSLSQDKSYFVIKNGKTSLRLKESEGTMLFDFLQKEWKHEN